jgi:hypothetical protein
VVVLRVILEAQLKTEEIMAAALVVLQAHPMVRVAL